MRSRSLSKLTTISSPSCGAAAVGAEPDTARFMTFTDVFITTGMAKVNPATVVRVLTVVVLPARSSICAETVKEPALVTPVMIACPVHDLAEPTKISVSLMPLTVTVGCLMLSEATSMTVMVSPTLALAPALELIVKVVSEGAELSPVGGMLVESGVSSPELPHATSKADSNKLATVDGSKLAKVDGSGLATVDGSGLALMGVGRWLALVDGRWASVCDGRWASVGGSGLALVGDDTVATVRGSGLALVDGRWASVGGSGLALVGDGTVASVGRECRDESSTGKRLCDCVAAGDNVVMIFINSSPVEVVKIG